MNPVFEAVIFDFDGVIADTEWLHSETFRRVLAEEKIFITDDDHGARFLGINDRAALAKAFGEVNRVVSPNEVEALVARKSAYFTDRLAEVPAFPGVKALVEGLHEHGVPLAIASGGRGAEIGTILKLQGLRERFQAVYSADEVPRSKPAPDLFLAAFNGLKKAHGGLSPEKCLAIEDSVHGVRAAKAAGLYCIAVEHSFPRERLAEADRIVERIVQIRWQDIVQL